MSIRYPALGHERRGSERDIERRLVREILGAERVGARLVADGKIPPTEVGIGLHTGDAVVATSAPRSAARTR